MRIAAGLLAAGLALGGDYAAEGERWWKDVAALAGDGFEGRDTGSPGHRRAAEFVAGEFERAGLKPAGTQAYFQPVELQSRTLREAESFVELAGTGGVQRLNLGEDAVLMARGESGAVVEADAVFIGQGLRIPEAKIDDLAGLDLKGKLVVLINGAPASVPGPIAAHCQGSERWKQLRAAGAVGIVSIQNPKQRDIPWERAAAARKRPSMVLRDPAMNEYEGLRLSLALRAERADVWFAGTGHTVAELLALADADKPLPKFPLRAKVRAKVVYETAPAVSDNVLAVLPGSDPALRNEYVVFSAHLDHVGRCRPDAADAICNGAMDNASGVATLLAIAREFAGRSERPKRSLLFAAVTGEEKGLLGSKYVARRPTVPASAVVANLNVDMFLPIVPLKSMNVFGLEESTLGAVSREVAGRMALRIVGDREPKRSLFVRSDQYSFIREGVPSLYFKFDAEPGSPEEKLMKTWIRERYHAPSDDIHQPVERAAAAQFNAYVAAVGDAIANAPERPQWLPTSFFRRFAKQP